MVEPRFRNYLAQLQNFLKAVMAPLGLGLQLLQEVLHFFGGFTWLGGSAL